MNETSKTTRSGWLMVGAAVALFATACGASDGGIDGHFEGNNSSYSANNGATVDGGDTSSNSSANNGSSWDSGNNGSPNNGSTWESGEDSWESGEGGEGGEGEPGEDALPMPGQLTAGEWQDHVHWDYWRELMEPSEQGADWSDYVKRWGMFPVERVPVHVTTSAGEDAIDVPVQLLTGEGEVLWEARTNNRGRAQLFPAFFDGAQAPATYHVDAAGVTSDPLQAPPEGEVALELTTYQAPPAALDLMFVVDVTGSMSDELRYLQSEMRDVIQRVNAERPGLTVRTSFNFYCDPNDSFLVASGPFEADLSDALEQLDSAPRCGGGDFPEAVDEGLEDGVMDHQWSTSATSRMLFIVLDAPPHEEQEDLGRLANVTRAAAKQGIQIVPITSSGADKSTEFLMRALAIATNGTYTFLTDHSGIGGSHIEPTTGPYKVEYLNDLLARVILRSTE